MYNNRITITGFLGKDAESRTARNDRTSTTLSVATKRRWKNQESGNYESQTTWHRCIVYGRPSTFAATLMKGAHVQIEGELRTREYTEKASAKNAAPGRKFITEIRVFRIIKLDRAAKPNPEGAA